MTSKWAVNDFLDQYESQKTKKSYRTALKQFFTVAFPELKTSKALQLLDKLSLQYFEKDRDIRKDIIAYKNSIKHQAPKTRQSKLSPIFRYFEDNGIEFAKSFTRNLYGKNSESITTEHVPTAEEIGRIIQYLPIQAKTLTLVLASSGMRIGEAIQLTLNDIELDRNPVRINIPARARVQVILRWYLLINITKIGKSHTIR